MDTPTTMASSPNTGIDPLVTIVLLNWNGKAVTLDCLASLRATRYERRRIVVVDNGSTDGSVEIIRRDHPEVELLEMGTNLGFARGANVGMRYALDHGADMLLLLNNDTVVDPDFLRYMVDALKTSPSIGLVAPKIYYFEEPNRIWFAGGELSMWTGTLRHIGIREYDHGQFDVPREIPHACGCCLLARRSLAEQVGLLDESYYLYTEDADWVMRARRGGYGVSYEPRAKIWHKVSVDSGGHLSWHKNKNKFLSNFRFFARYARWYHWLVFPWLNILVNGVAAVRYVLSRRRSVER
jgi:GT2 family glycosyltransferase